MATNDKKDLAERIARMLESETQNPDMAALFASIEKINHRLAKIESSVGSGTIAPQAINSNHASQEKFAVLEAMADQIIEGVTKEKACTFEPNGRPCDHCSMCSSRGF